MRNFFARGLNIFPPINLNSLVFPFSFSLTPVDIPKSDSENRIESSVVTSSVVTSLVTNKKSLERYLTQIQKDFDGKK